MLPNTKAFRGELVTNVEYEESSMELLMRFYREEVNHE